MASIRLSQETEEKLARICVRKGLTKSDCVRLAIDQFVMAETERDPYELLNEIRARFQVKGSKLKDGASRHSQILKERLRAKHSR